MVVGNKFFVVERKILVISIFITLGAVAFLSGYLLTPANYIGQTSIAGKNSDSQTGSLIERFNNNVDIKSSEDKAPKTLPVSSRKFLSFVNLFTDSQKIVAVESNGNIVEIDTSALTEKLYYTGQTNIVEAVLSPAGDSIVYSFYDARNNKKHAYLNFRKGELAPIVGDVRSIAFSPRGDQTVYLVSRSQASGTGHGELLISKGGNVIKRALKTRLDAAVVNWPSDFIFIISYNKDGYGDLFVLKEGDVLNKVLSYQYDLNINWSPSGSKIVFSTKNENGSEHLFYQDINANSAVKDLDINTAASKCVWATEEEVICGIKDKVQLRDEFYKIGLADGSKTLVATPSINLLTKELALNRSGDTIFVLNDIDSKLYALALK